MENNSLCTVPNCTACTKPVVTNNNEWIEERFFAEGIFYEDADKCVHSKDVPSTILLTTQDMLKDCQRKTLELVLPEEIQILNPIAPQGWTANGWNEARSEILRRASEAGITIDDL